jgi:hypothetical protein
MHLRLASLELMVRKNVAKVASFERDRKEDLDRWRRANAKRCSSSSSDMVKHLKELRTEFFKGTGHE